MMKKYSALTKYINLLKNDIVGEWNCDKENDGSSERPIHVPFVSYSIAVNNLADDIYKFAKESNEIIPSKYAEILQANGIEWGYDSMMKADASELDAQCILALLIASLRAERFCDGALLGGMDMQKKLFLSAALGLAMFANTAFAEVNTAYLANELRSYPGWPLEVYCNATDVNVRTQPNTDCDVITMLQRGDKFYVSRVVDVVNSEYKWLLGTTEKGYVGFMASKYLDTTPRAASAAGRFNAALEADWIMDPEIFASGAYYPGPVEQNTDDTITYADKKLQVGPRLFYIDSAKNRVSEVKINKLHGMMAGYAVGQLLNTDSQIRLDGYLKMNGWEYDYMSRGRSDTHYMIGWLKYAYNARGQKFLHKSFYVKLDSKEVISEIIYCEHDVH